MFWSACKSNIFIMCLIRSAASLELKNLLNGFGFGFQEQFLFAVVPAAVGSPIVRWFLEGTVSFHSEYAKSSHLYSWVLSL